MNESISSKSPKTGLAAIPQTGGSVALSPASGSGSARTTSRREQVQNHGKLSPLTALNNSASSRHASPTQHTAPSEGSGPLSPLRANQPFTPVRNTRSSSTTERLSRNTPKFSKMFSRSPAKSSEALPEAEAVAYDVPVACKVVEGYLPSDNAQHISKKKLSEPDHKLEKHEAPSNDGVDAHSRGDGGKSASHIASQNYMTLLKAQLDNNKQNFKTIGKFIADIGEALTHR